MWPSTLLLAQVCSRHRSLLPLFPVVLTTGKSKSEEPLPQKAHVKWPGLARNDLARLWQAETEACTDLSVTQSRSLLQLHHISSSGIKLQLSVWTFENKQLCLPSIIYYNSLQFSINLSISVMLCNCSRFQPQGFLGVCPPPIWPAMLTVPFLQTPSFKCVSVQRPWGTCGGEPQGFPGTRAYSCVCVLAPGLCFLTVHRWT